MKSKKVFMKRAAAILMVLVLTVMDIPQTALFEVGADEIVNPDVSEDPEAAENNLLVFEVGDNHCDKAGEILACIGGRQYKRKITEVWLSAICITTIIQGLWLFPVRVHQH